MADKKSSGAKTTALIIGAVAIVIYAITILLNS